MDKQAFYCLNHGRQESYVKNCPICGEKMKMVSRYEWFLSDAIQNLLAIYGIWYIVHEQWPMMDHRGFCWYWDLMVEFKGLRSGIKYRIAIDVQGERHKRQKRYKGPGGGYTRDFDKRWETLQRRNGIDDCRYFTNEECTKTEVYCTAGAFVEELRSW